jgi:4-aminobutyrate aminotransferase-like enzyme
VLNVVEEEKLIDNARIVGAYLRDGLKTLAARHSLIGDVRGEGLYVGLELVRNGDPTIAASTEAATLVNALVEHRILINYSGPRANVLKIRPPLVFSRSNADQIIGAIDDVLNGWQRSAQY